MGKGSRNRAEKAKRRKARKDRKAASSASSSAGFGTRITVPVWEYPSYARMSAEASGLDGGEPLSADAFLDVLMWTPIETVLEGRVRRKAPMQSAIDLDLSRDEYIEFMRLQHEHRQVQWDPVALRYLFEYVHPDGSECDCETFVCEFEPESSMQPVISPYGWIDELEP